MASTRKSRVGFGKFDISKIVSMQATVAVIRAIEGLSKDKYDPNIIYTNKGRYAHGIKPSIFSIKV